MQLKWPNDILHAGCKLAGLLCERVHKADLIGVGLNVNLSPAAAPKGLRGQITSLWQTAQRRFDLTDVLITLARHLHPALARRGERFFSETLRRYDAHHALTGRRVTVSSLDDSRTLAGTVQGLDSHGRLILRDRAGRVHRVISGQVQMR